MSRPCSDCKSSFEDYPRRQTEVRCGNIAAPPPWRPMLGGYEAVVAIVNIKMATQLGGAERSGGEGGVERN